MGEHYYLSHIVRSLECSTLCAMYSIHYNRSTNNPRCNMLSLIIDELRTCSRTGPSGHSQALAQPKPMIITTAVLTRCHRHQAVMYSTTRASSDRRRTTPRRDNGIMSVRVEHDKSFAPFGAHVWMRERVIFIRMQTLARTYHSHTHLLWRGAAAICLRA